MKKIIPLTEQKVRAWQGKHLTGDKYTVISGKVEG